MSLTRSRTPKDDAQRRGIAPEDKKKLTKAERKQMRRGSWLDAFSRQNLADTILTGYLPIFVALIVIVLPLAWMVSSSFKPPTEIVTLNPTLLPQDPTLDNFGNVVDRVPLLTMFGNSIYVTVVGSSIKVLLAVTTAYALVFIKVPGRNFIFLGILVALMVPPEVSMLPNYLTITGLGGRDTLWGIILPGLGTAFGTFLLRQHFMALPKEMFEAAELDAPDTSASSSRSRRRSPSRPSPPSGWSPWSTSGTASCGRWSSPAAPRR